MHVHPSFKLELGENHHYVWDSITIQRTLNALAGVDINMPNPAGLFTTLPSEDLAIKVYAGWNTDTPPLLFDGYMDDPKWGVKVRDMILTIAGRDFGRSIFDEATVDASFNSYGNPITNGYIIAYIEYLNDNLSTPLVDLFERNTTDDNDNSFQYTFGYKKVIEAIKNLIAYGNYEWFMGHDDGNRKWFVRPPKELIADNVAHAFIVGDVSQYDDIPAGATIHHINSLSLGENYGFKKNYVKVIGDGVDGKWPGTEPSNPKHYVHEDGGITSTGDAQNAAHRIHTEKSGPKIPIEFSAAGIEALTVGDVIYVNDHKYGASRLPSNILRLINITDTLSFGSGWNAKFKVADFVPTMFDFIQGTSGL